MKIRSASVALVGLSFLMACGVDSMILAQDASVTDAWKERYEHRSVEGADGSRLNYRWFMPEVPEGTKVPVLVFLHGAGERGDDNTITLVHGARDFVSDAVQSKQPCAVLIPQCPTEDKWVDVPWTADEHQLNEQPTGPLKLVVQALDEHLKNEPLDEKRIYLTGLSMGGFGTWDLLARYPDKFAAAVPICGGGDASEAVVSRFKHVPLWVFHGADDGVVKPTRSRAMIAALEAVGGEPKYTEYPETGHDSWTRTYANPELYAWLFAQKLAD